MDTYLINLVAQETSSTLNGFGELSPPIQVALFLGALSLATAAIVSMTAFTRIIIVLSFVRRALATPEIPPNQVLIGLSMFMTFFVMAPTMKTIYDDGVQPYMASLETTNDELKSEKLTELTRVSFREIKVFMASHTMDDELLMFFQLSATPPPSVSEDPESELLYNVDDLPPQILIPAFVISELKIAFIMGFCIYIPFLLIDLVVSTILMSLGMMMMSPPVVSTPCKLLLFVLVDGWQLISRALIDSFGG